MVKCFAHKSGKDLVTLGNKYADQLAKYCALQDETVVQENENYELRISTIQNAENVNCFFMSSI